MRLHGTEARRHCILDQFRGHSLRHCGSRDLASSRDDVRVPRLLSPIPAQSVPRVHHSPETTRQNARQGFGANNLIAGGPAIQSGTDLGRWHAIQVWE